MPAGPFHVKALFEYSSPHEDDLEFGVGQIITVTEEEDEEWYNGEYVDDNGTKHHGLFPRNFVEKYEPIAPPRPTRRAKKETEPVTQEDTPVEVAPPGPPSPKPEDLPAPPPPPTQPEEPAVEEVRAASPPARANPAPPPVPALQPAKAPESASKETVAQPKPGPPPVAAKSGSIRDRIAAFNKPGSGPVTPFKPSSLNYVKKPFVPPPPSRDAFIPPPRAEPPPRMYVRENEANAVNDEPEELGSVSATPAASASYEQTPTSEDEHKPTSLQERIAILQKQQAEAAQRHADALAKKDKSKRLPKKRAENEPVIQSSDLERSATLERRDTEGSADRPSLDEVRVVPSHRRRVSKDQSVKDGNEADMSGAGDTTEGVEDLTEREDGDDDAHAVSQRLEGEEEEADEDEDEDEEDVDPEVRRKEELRARMAKMSGGMGMPGMFMPMPAPSLPKKKKPATAREQGASGPTEEPSPSSRAAPPVPAMMALPGMSTRQSSEQPRDDEPESRPSARAPPPAPIRQHPSIEEEAGVYEEDDPTPLPLSPASPPPVPSGRPAPPPVPTEVTAPPLPEASIKSPSAGSESDDELSEQPRPSTESQQRGGPPPAMRSPPPPPPVLPSPTSPTSPRFSSMPPPIPGVEDIEPTSPTSYVPPASSRRNSRIPPPIPGAAAPALPPAQTRPPPPPPPGPSIEHGADEYDLPSRPPPHPTDHGEEEVTEYEGDYDTDIASLAPHKDALKSTAREAGSEEDVTTYDSSADVPATVPPPVPSSAPLRAVPPPPVRAPAPPTTRHSVDVPRSAPPPPPPAKEPESAGSYQPYGHAIPKMTGYQPGGLSYDERGGAQELPSMPSPSLEAMTPAGQQPTRGFRQSMDAQRVLNRASMDASRPSMDIGFIAEDADLALQTGWWSQSNQVPPVFQGRKDISFETEESTSTNFGAKTVITRTISILFIDYSKTIITVQYDPYDASDIEVHQHHEPPPRSLRQDQLENSHDRFGRAIADMASSKKDSVVGDGTPHGLVQELLRPFKDALRPVGTRAFGALVYANMANASTLLHDEIRAGDIISFRNTRFQGKHGAMHAKYSVEVGKPDHVAVVAEWDGTKKKVRAWEQGRESKKVKMESFKLGDLRSGEVKVWRVMPRSWVGWSTKH